MSSKQGNLWDLPPEPAVPDAHFDGPDYEPEQDHKRLRGQILDIFELMADGNWRTLREIRFATGHPEASISAQLRHLRKKRFGGHHVDRRREGAKWEYRVRRAI